METAFTGGYMGQEKQIANGLGPYWFPSAWRTRLTKMSSLYFDEASWTKHDEGYYKKDPKRSVCDWKFLQAMIRDASKTTTLGRLLLCLLLALFFYTCVRALGSHSYNKNY